MILFFRDMNHTVENALSCKFLDLVQVQMTCKI